MASCLKQNSVKSKIYSIQSFSPNAILQSTLILRTPRYNEQPDNTDSSYIPGKNNLQTIDWNKLPLFLIRTPAKEDTTQGPYSVRYTKGSRLYFSSRVEGNKAKGIPRRSFTEWEMSIDFFFIYIGLGAKENKFKNRNLKNSRV